MSDCSRCGARLMFSARQRGDGMCGPCSRGDNADVTVGDDLPGGEAGARHNWVSAVLDMSAGPKRTAELRQMIIDAMDVVEQEEDGYRLARALEAFDLPADVRIGDAPPASSTFSTFTILLTPSQIVTLKTGRGHAERCVYSGGGRWTCVSGCNAGRA